MSPSFQESSQFRTLFSYAAAAAFIVASAGLNCNQTATQPQTAPTQTSNSMGGLHEFGDVSVDLGGQSLSHTFEIVNNSTVELQLVELKTTCGCLNATLKPETIAPGQQALLETSLSLQSSGVVEHLAILILTDGEQRKFTLRGRGTRDYEFRPIPKSTRIRHDQKELRIRLLVVDRHGTGEAQPPTVTLDGKPLRTRFEDWVSLEERNEKTGRPKRQLGTCWVDLSSFKGSYPVQLKIQARGGGEATVQLEQIE